MERTVFNRSCHIDKGEYTESGSTLSFFIDKVRQGR